MSGIATWKVRLDLLHRRSDCDDAIVQALSAAIEAG
jgi:hypothetical protein